MALNGSRVPSIVRNPISVQNLTFCVPARRKRSESLKLSPFSLLANSYSLGKGREIRTLLDNLSFELEDGGRLALIGANGAGKTTLLRLLAGSFTPTLGTVITRGRVQALLNVTLGLRNEATGLENIYLRAFSMGMTLAETRDLVPAIIEFSEIGDAIHDPIRTYSSGMRARLAFSIVTARDPNILLMDEWISTGDQAFVVKAQQRLRSQIRECRGLVLASHSPSILTEICTHGLVLHKGQSMFFGKIGDALAFYADAAPAAQKQHNTAHASAGS